MNNEAIGKAARSLRLHNHYSQKDAAALLGVTQVHLCGIEAGRAMPSWQLLDDMKRLYWHDVYMVAWCIGGDVMDLPKALRPAARALKKVWKQELKKVLTT